MGTRNFSAWFMWGSLAICGVILPLVIGQDPEHEILVRLLRALGAAGFLTGLVSLFRSSGDSAPGAGAVGAAADVPRTLCNNPLAAAHGTLPLAERIEMAAAESSYYGRSLGLIEYNLASYRSIAHLHGEPAAVSAMDFVVGMLQMLLRDTDRIERIGKDRFVICLALLPDEETLRAVHGRVANAMCKMRIEALNGGAIEYDCGVALYPINGATGANLIEYARRECDAARDRRLGAEKARHVATAELGNATMSAAAA